MIEFVRSHRVVRHWPFAIAASIWLLLLFIPPLSQSELVRAVVAIGCIVLMLFQWRAYCREPRGTSFFFLSVVVVGFGIANLWLALNVLRFYTYDADSGRGIHIIVVRIQEALLWIEGALFAVVSGWGVYRLYRSGKVGTSRALKIVSWFALSGFITTWLLLGYSAYCIWRGTHVWQPVFLVLCPSSIVAIGLDGSSTLGALIGWLFIAVANTVMYAAIGLALSPVLRLLLPGKKGLQ